MPNDGLSVEAGEPLGCGVHRGDGAADIGREDRKGRGVDERLREAVHLLDLPLAGAFRGEVVQCDGDAALHLDGLQLEPEIVAGVAAIADLAGVGEAGSFDLAEPFHEAALRQRWKRLAERHSNEVAPAVEEELFGVGVDEAEAEIAVFVEGATLALKNEKRLAAGFGGGDKALVRALGGLTKSLHLVEHRQQQHDAASKY